MLSGFVFPWQRQCVVVRAVELPRETSKELRHGKIGFAIAVVHRRIEDHRAAGRESRVSAPQVAVQQAGRWLMTCEQFEEIFFFKIEAILAGKLELGP